MAVNPSLLMFIDDDKDFLYLMQRIAGKVAGVADVLTANHGHDAMEQFKAFIAENCDLPALVFVDINMPVMNGFEFLDAFKGLAEQYPVLIEIVHVVMLSSSSDDKDKKRAFATGVVKDFLVKQPGNLMKANIERLLVESQHISTGL